MKPIYIRIAVYSLLAFLLLWDSWAIWKDAGLYAGDRIKEHLINISGFMVIFHLLLCGLSLLGIFLYNRFTGDLRVAQKPLIRKQLLGGLLVIALNAVAFYIARH